MKKFLAPSSFLIASLKILSISSVSMGLFPPPRTYSEPINDPIEWLREITKKGNERLKNTNINFDEIFSQRSLDKASEFAHNLIKSDKTVQITYGFVAGYASGYCVKRVAKVAAFALGGLFVIIQSLSFNGYMNINHERIKKDFEVSFFYSFYLYKSNLKNLH